MNSILPLIKNNIDPDTKTQKKVKALIQQLCKDSSLEYDEFLYLLDNISPVTATYLKESAYQAKQPHYGDKVYLRSLIEISNYCTRGCLYCGISRYNTSVNRYRLTIDEILESCESAYLLGYKTFVLQAGEDPALSKEFISNVIITIKNKYPDTRITLSLGEQTKDTYQAWFDSGADRYLLRHETASPKLYESVHSKDMSLDIRMKCLQDLRDIGYQVGAGFMVGLPNQINADLVQDILFLKELNPHMVGIGPYLCHEDTILKGNDSGTLEETLVLLSIVRLLLPKVLLPSTTALGTIAKNGRELGLKAGANVLMPNVSPTQYRKDYEIYQNKICLTDTAETCYFCIRGRIRKYNHQADFSVGDHVDIKRSVTND